jgi:glycine cleavage system H lipoate-binding protein
MVIFLVFLTFVVAIAAFALVAWYRRRREIRQSVERTTESVTGDLYWDAGHLWVRPVGGGAARIGLDSFALRVVGRVDEVRLPRAGQAVSRGERLFSVRQGTRWADFRSPVDGLVRQVNRSAGPIAAVSARREAGESTWVCEVEAEDLATSLEGLLDKSAVRGWMARELERVLAFFRETAGPEARLGAVLPDGGTLVDGLLESVDDEDWDRFTRIFFLRQA